MEELSGINVRDVEVFAQSHAVAIAAAIMTGKVQNLCLSLKSIQTYLILSLSMLSMRRKVKSIGLLKVAKSD